MILLFSSACSGNNSPIHLIDKERSTSLFTHFTVLRATEISSNIMHIFQDSKNVIWLGSWKDGLYSFDGKTLLHYKSKERQNGYRVHEIKEDKKGNMIVNTELGVFCYNRINFTQIPVNNSFENNWRLSDQDIWLRSANEPACIYRYDGQTLFKLKIPACPLGEDYQRKKPSSLNPYDVYYTYIDSQGFLWLGTSVLGAMRYNGIDFQYFDIRYFTNLYVYKPIIDVVTTMTDEIENNVLTSLKLNLKNSLIKKIYILLEPKLFKNKNNILELVLNKYNILSNNKIIIKLIDKIPSYYDIINFINNNNKINDIVCIINSDIALTNSFKILNKCNFNEHFICLTRYNIKDNTNHKIIVR